MVDFKSYLHDRYNGGKDFVRNVIQPIFGEDNYEDAYEEDVLENHSDLSKHAASSGVSQILRLGTISIPMNPTNVYEITVGDHVKMEWQRFTM